MKPRNANEWLQRAQAIVRANRQIGTPEDEPQAEEERHHLPFHEETMADLAALTIRKPNSSGDRN